MSLLLTIWDQEYNQPAGQKRRRRLQGSPSFVRRTPSVAEAIVVVAGAEDANYYDISMADGASSGMAQLLSQQSSSIA